MNPIASPTSALDALRAASPKTVGPADEGWDAARVAFNVLVDQNPVAVAYPASPAEVAAIVGVAREHGLRVVPQTTGHGVGPLGPVDDAVLVRLSEMRTVTIDAGRQFARVEAGAVWRDVVDPASELGLAALHGSSPTVGVVGYTLSGGMGWYARKHGLACNHVLAVELVTADGECVRATADQNADLFWAVRGGGGNFGVVTAIEIELFPISEVYAGSLFFPWERADEVLKTWNALLPSMPDEMTSVGRIIKFPPFPEVPEVFRGRSFAVIQAAHLGTAEEGEALLAPLRELGPELDMFAMQGPAALADLHMDPPAPVPHHLDHTLVSRLDDAAIGAIVDQTGAESDSALMGIELRHTGGAMARSADDHGMLDVIPGEVLVFMLGVPMAPEMGPAIAADMQRMHELLAPSRAGVYPSFTERTVPLADTLGDAGAQRLRAVKASVDAADVMRGNHPVA